MEFALLKTLINREFYQEHKALSDHNIFRSKETQTIKAAIDTAMTTYENGLNSHDVEALFFAEHNSDTTAKKEGFRELFQKIHTAPVLNASVAHDVLVKLHRTQAADELTNIAYEMANDNVTSLQPLREFLEKREVDFLPSLKIKFGTTDLIELLQKRALEFRWKINIPSVAKYVPGVNAGQLIVGAARPNTGKTSSHAFLCVGKGGFAHQGAKVLILANEETTDRVSHRYITAACNETLGNIATNVKPALETWKTIEDNLRFIDALDWNLTQAETAIKIIQPDIVIADMADKFAPDGRYNSIHETLKATYVQFRILARRYNCAIFAMSQLSADAEGKVFVDMSMLEGSKTGKASEADILFAITQTPSIQRVEEDDENATSERHWLILKNKLTGRHGKITTMFNPETATFIA